jgi:hypothetical protein
MLKYKIYVWHDLAYLHWAPSSGRLRQAAHTGDIAYTSGGKRVNELSTAYYITYMIYICI